MFQADPDWPTQKILDEIKNKASWAEKYPGAVLQPMSALMVRLSNDAANSASKLENQTGTLIRLTWALLALTFLLFGKEALQFYKDDYLSYHQGEKSKQNASVKEQPTGNSSIGAGGIVNPGGGHG
jgi:hypothetical protein